MKHSILLTLFVIQAIFGWTQENDIVKYNLDNGLTVILNIDHSQPTVFGCVAVRAGSKDDPSDATGLAHYMEHVMFKGTENLGTSDWEAEKPHYENIINLYEELRNTDDADERKEINKKINKESLLAGKYAIPNEFSNLVQAMGGTGLNAGTGYDYTFYHNSFPPFQIRRWLDLYANRFVNPVFRGFQSELETVYEEKNMYSDNPFRAVQNDFLSNAFGNENPYGRLILGKTEDLKNPSIKRITEFYNAFYVPNNMALILSGDIDLETIKPMIEETFGKWEKRQAIGQPNKPENMVLAEPIKIKEKLTPYPMFLLGYPAVQVNNPEEYAVELCARLLSNNNNTGLLDKLVLEGDLLSANASFMQLKHAGLIQISAIPTFDRNQMIYDSFSSVEKMIYAEITKLKQGQFEDWLVDALKRELIMEHNELYESPTNMGIALMQNYANETGLDHFLNFNEVVQAITKDDIIKMANKYFTENHITYLSDIGNPKKDNLKKPVFEPIDPTPGQKSEYSSYIETIPLSKVNEDFVDFQNDVERTSFKDKVNLFYTKNPKNDNFYLTIKFGIGEGKIPTLGLATQLMNSAGVMAQYSPQKLKNEYSKLGCSVNFYNDDSYLYINLKGNEENLVSACRLLSKTFLLPELDEKQMNNLIGGVIAQRRAEKRDKNSQASAMYDYMVYGEQSPELIRPSVSDLQSLTISDLTGAFISATQYEASIHYVGNLPFETVNSKLKSSLALPANLKTSDSPYIRPVTERKEDKILFLHNSEARQSSIYLFINGKEFNLEDQAIIDAFNQYFSGGFNGLVLQELREKRSFAYSAGAYYQSPPVQKKETKFIGSISTQSDKTADAISEFLSLINDMPQKPERISNIKNYLVLSSQASKPNFKYLSESIEKWEQKGYSDDPNKLTIPKYKELTFEDIDNFYKNEIAGHPITIAIVGNKKEIDMDKLKAINKVTRLNNGKIFKD